MASEIESIFTNQNYNPDNYNNSNIADLEDSLVKLNHAYTNKEALVTDIVYDSLVERLGQLKPKSQVLQMVGSQPVEGAVPLPVWMGSLDKVKPTTKALSKFLSKEPFSYTISEKLDGISLLLVRRSKTWSCYTRGNGKLGQNVTSTILDYITIPPSKLLRKVGDIVIRGEYILPKTAADDLQTTKNLRSIISGAVNAKVAKHEVLKLSRFVAYSLPTSNMTPSQQFCQLKSFGFNIPKISQTKGNVNEELLEKTLISWRNGSIYDIDGIVVSKEVIEAPQIDKNPKMSVAFKMSLEDQVRVTEVIKVEWNASKDGYLKPVVVVKAVKIDGCNISRVTGNNAKFVLGKKIGPGATIKIIRSGDVIPKIVEVIKPCKLCSIPEVDCNWSESQTDLIMTEVTSKDKALLYFVKTIGIKYLNISLCQKLAVAKIDHPEALVTVSKETLASLDGLAEKSATKIHHQIKESLERVDTLDLIVSLNLLGRSMGRSRLALLSETIGLDMLVNQMSIIPAETIKTIPGFSDKLAKQLSEGLVQVEQYLQMSPTLHNYFRQAFQRDSNMDNETYEQDIATVNQSSKYKGLKLVFTGARDKELEATILKGGGKIGNSISKATSYLIKGDDQEAKKPSSKEMNAIQMSIKVISISDFKNDYC